MYNKKNLRRDRVASSSGVALGISCIISKRCVVAAIVCGGIGLCLIKDSVKKFKMYD